MGKIKAYFNQNFEAFFILGILVATTCVNYFFSYKLSFLNFYFLPISLAGYFLGTRKAVLAATLSVMLIGFYAYVEPERFAFSNTHLELTMALVIWGAFLILAAVIVGKQHEVIKRENENVKTLNAKLQNSYDELTFANTKLKDYSANLESMVKERTSKLNQSKEAIESLKLKVEETLFRSMDRNVAKLIIDGRLRTEKRQVTVLFSDLCSFTEYSSKQNPESVVQQLNRYLEEMESVLLRYNGHIDKYLGDGIMVEFGAPTDFDKQCLLAVLAALKMQEVLKVKKYPWQMRVGISSGMSILGMIGSKRQSYTTIGDTVNLAARLESNCPPGSIVIDESTAKQISDFVELKPFKLGPHNKLKGFDTEFNLFEVVRLKDMFAGNDAFPEGLVVKYLPLVQSCGLPDALTLPVEGLDGAVGHSQKVAVLAAAIADQVITDQRAKHEVVAAAYAADCGKDIIHHHILNRKGRLMDVEYEDIKKHPDESVRNLIKIGIDSKTLHAMVRHSHERMDGRGYPEGLKGEDIPIGARIIAVADAYSALTSYRPYREKWTMDAALAEIERASKEGHYDSKIVGCLKQVLHSQLAKQRKPA